MDRYLLAQGVSTEWIFIRDFSASELLYECFESKAIQGSVKAIEAADAVVVATPVYKAAYTGLLKAYLDGLPQSILGNKVILPIVIGGSPAHLLVIDYALKPV